MGAGHEASTDIPPVISPASKDRIERLIQVGIFPISEVIECTSKQIPSDCLQSAVDEGAELLLDGRGITVKMNFVFVLQLFSQLWD